MEDNKLLKNLIDSLIDEKKSERRYRYISRGIIIFFIVLILFLLPSTNTNFTDNHVAVIDINGMISVAGPVNVKKILPLIKDAFNNDSCEGVILKINSPGGSATQSKIIFDEILKIRGTSKKKIFSVIEDVGASGGYYIAASGEKIFSSPSSIVGSIGVRLDSFNIESLVQKLGIEPQILSSGKDKTILDPFSKLSSMHRLHLENLLSDIHNQFISDIKLSRNKKIMDKNVFTGLFWTGTEAYKNGLVDEIASIYDVNNKYFNNVTMITYNKNDNYLKKILNNYIDFPVKFYEYGIKY